MVVLFLLAVAAVIFAVDAVLGVTWLWTSDTRKITAAVTSAPQT